MIERKISLISALLLSLTVVSPELLMSANMSKIQPMMLSTQSKFSRKVLTSFEMALDVEETLLIEEWTNGTKLTASEHIWLNNAGCRDVWVNCTVWGSQGEYQRIVESRKLAAVRSVKATSSSVYPYKYCDDSSDWLWFLQKGNNGTHLVSYNKDDNYDGGPGREAKYHPGEWYWQGNLTGNQMTHIHLSKKDLLDWYNGLIDSAILWGIIFAGIAGVASLIGGVAIVLKCPPVAAAGIIAGLSSIISAIVQYIYRIQLAIWVRDVVTDPFAGDGWTWMGAIVEFIAGLITSTGRMCQVGHDTFMTFGRSIDYYEVRNWMQNWGAEGIFNPSPHDYLVAWWTKTESKSYRVIGR